MMGFFARAADAAAVGVFITICLCLPVRAQDIVPPLCRSLSKLDNTFTICRTASGYSAAMSMGMLDEEFLFAARVESGSAENDSTDNEAALDQRAKVLANQLLKVTRVSTLQEGLQVVEIPTQYYFDPASPLARSRESTISPSVVAVAEQRDGIITIPLDTLAPGDVLISNEPHPSNTEFVVEKLKGANPIRVHYSLVRLEPSDYVPREADYRVGFWTVQSDDLGRATGPAYHDFIMRWNLKKKDPAAALSVPVTPITFWIENTTPTEFIDAVKRGVLAWNKAFEQAGFKDAIEVKIQTGKENWTPGDIHHNMIRWISSPNLASLLDYSGITKPIANPLTGELLNATLVLNFWEFRNAFLEDKLFASTAVANAARPDLNQLFAQTNAPQAGDVAFGLLALKEQRANQPELRRLILECVTKTVAHEVGHALGLAHNFRGSMLRRFADLQRPADDAHPFGGSIMDYYPPNIARKGTHQGAYYMNSVGPYDSWAVQFGYTPTLAPAAKDHLLARSVEPQLAYAGDDDFARAVDPRAMQFDLSSDPVEWAGDYIGLIDDTIAGLKSQIASSNQTYQSLFDTFADLRTRRLWALRALARHIGGVYIEPPSSAAPGAQPLFKPVTASGQKQAMSSLAKYLFAPDGFVIPSDLLQHLEQERRVRTIDIVPQPARPVISDPPVSTWVLRAQSTILDLIINPSTLSRLTNSRSYGNSYTAQNALSDLTDAIFVSDMNGNVNPFRQNLQITYVQKLIAAYGLKDDNGNLAFDSVARSALLKQIKRINEEESLRLWAQLFLGFNQETIAHRENLRLTTSRQLSSHMFSPTIIVKQE